MKIHSDWKCLNCGWRISVEYPLEMATKVMQSLEYQHSFASTHCKELILKVQY